MTHPRRKLAPATVVDIRRDYQLRRNAKEMIALGKAMLTSIPTCNDYARQLGTTDTVILSAAMGRTYKDIGNA